MSRLLGSILLGLGLEILELLNGWTILDFFLFLKYDNLTLALLIIHMNTGTLPNVGDIITFNSVWQLNVLKDLDDHFPHGVITSKKKYGELNHEYKKNSLTLFGTLAYPLSIGATYLNEQAVYIVRWATRDPELAKSYKYINEEWFYNSSFVIISRA